MASLFDSARARAKEAAQAVLCQAGGIQRAINDFNGKANPFYTGSRGEDVTRRLERELSRFCPVPPTKAPPDAPPDPPFSGGQCPGVDYFVSGVFEGWSYGNFGEAVLTSPASPSTIGPVTGPISFSLTTVSQNFGPPIGTVPLESLLLNGANGTSRGVYSNRHPNTFFSDILVERADEQPDTCGDPPKVPSPPYPPTDPRPPFPGIDVDIPGYPPVTVQLNPVVGIVNVNVEGGITVPVTVNASFDLGDQSFDIDFNFDVDLGDPGAEPRVPPTEPPLDPDGRPAPPDCPPPPDCAPGDEEDEEPDEPPIDPEDPEDKKEQEIKSVRVMSVVNPVQSSATEILMTGGAPNILAPRIGSVKFVYAVTTGVVAWSTDIDVKATNQVIPAPKMGLRCLGAVFSPGAGVVGETFFTRGRRCDCG